METVELITCWFQRVEGSLLGSRRPASVPCHAESILTRRVSFDSYEAVVFLWMWWILILSDES